MNILIKLMSIVSLVIAPTLAQIAGRDGAAVASADQKKEIIVEPVAVAKDGKTVTLK